MNIRVRRRHADDGHVVLGEEAVDGDGGAVVVELVEEGLFCIGGHDRNHLRRRSITGPNQALQQHPTPPSG